ncbi:MAG: carboxylating nicotinate-nucleotide diphosphorylase [Pseudomonadota bacterium]|nr:carboxylating nicotinate-nucleotide diphosphorylase [Pseudomonadota bacterium]MEA3240717.1 carboxylating nicotinate-nucleotide diphosphorylase [Pseudomonadota bacterium]
MFSTEQLIKLALTEDLATGDITSMATVPSGSISTATVTFKETGIVAGLDIFSLVFRTLDASLKVEFQSHDGAEVASGVPVVFISGSSLPLLMGERVALNFLQHLSGIATLTRSYVRELPADSRAKIVDTRKTTPGWRSLEKYAVQVGGGKNHRMGLFDGVLIKDNHIKAAGSITQAVRQARQLAPHTLKIEVEVETLEQLHEACQAGADVVMLDNMETSLMKSAVEKTRELFPHVLLEASGGITRERIAEVATTAVDFISVGVLTHSARAIDISMNIMQTK